MRPPSGERALLRFCAAGPARFSVSTISLMTTRTRSPSAAEIHSRRRRSSSMPICRMQPPQQPDSAAAPCSCLPGSGSRRGGSRRSGRRRRPWQRPSARTGRQRGRSTSRAPLGVGSVLDARRARQVGGQVRAPVAEEGDDSRFKIFRHCSGSPRFPRRSRHPRTGSAGWRRKDRPPRMCRSLCRAPR